MSMLDFRSLFSGYVASMKRDIHTHTHTHTHKYLYSWLATSLSESLSQKSAKSRSLCSAADDAYPHALPAHSKHSCAEVPEKEPSFKSFFGLLVLLVCLVQECCTRHIGLLKPLRFVDPSEEDYKWVLQFPGNLLQNSSGFNRFLFYFLGGVWKSYLSSSPDLMLPDLDLPIYDSQVLTQLTRVWRTFTNLLNVSRSLMCSANR